LIIAQAIYQIAYIFASI